MLRSSNSIVFVRCRIRFMGADVFHRLLLDFVEQSHTPLKSQGPAFRLLNNSVFFYLHFIL